MSGSPPVPPFVGVVLAGGASTRMGRDKALVEVGGTPMIRIVAGTMSAAGASRILVAGGDTTSLSPMGLDVIPDRRRGLGPLSGILSALEALDSDGSSTGPGGEGPLMVSSPCDTPLVSAELITGLVRALVGDPGSAVAVTEGPAGLEPLLAAWRVRLCRETVARRLDSGSRSVRGVMESLATVSVAWANPKELTNVNTPEDLGALGPETGPSAGGSPRQRPH